MGDPAATPITAPSARQRTGNASFAGANARQGRRAIGTAGAGVMPSAEGSLRLHPSICARLGRRTAAVSIAAMTGDRSAWITTTKPVVSGGGSATPATSTMCSPGPKVLTFPSA